MNEISNKELEFANKYLDTGNGTQSIKEVFGIENDNVAAVKASRLLRKDKILDFLEDRASHVSSSLYELSQFAEDERVKFMACKDILDRIGIKSTDEQDNEKRQVMGNVIVFKTFSQENN